MTSVRNYLCQHQFNITRTHLVFFQFFKKLIFSPQEIISHLKEDSTLFFLDIAIDAVFDAFRQTAESFSRGMSEIYGPVARDLYKMSLYSMADSIKLNAKYFGGLLPPFSILSNVSVWSRGVAPSRRGSTVAPPLDDESISKEMKRHVWKCLKFYYPRESDLEREYDFASKGMFSTKPKNKRIEEVFEM